MAVGGPGGGDRDGAALWQARLDREEVAVAPRCSPHSSFSRLSAAAEQKRPSLEDSHHRCGGVRAVRTVSCPCVAGWKTQAHPGELI